MILICTWAVKHSFEMCKLFQFIKTRWVSQDARGITLHKMRKNPFFQCTRIGFEYTPGLSLRQNVFRTDICVCGRFARAYRPEVDVKYFS